jgi:hypothetical protein
MAQTLHMLTSVLLLSDTGWLWTGAIPLIHCTLAQLKRVLGLQARAVPYGTEHQSPFALLTLRGKQEPTRSDWSRGKYAALKFLVH